MGVVVVACAAFGLTISEAKTETVCLRTKGMPESTALFSVMAADEMYNQTSEFVYFGRNVNHNADLWVEEDRCIRNLELYDRPSAPLKLEIRILKAVVFETMLQGCVTWSPRACHCGRLCRAHPSFLTRCIG